MKNIKTSILIVMLVLVHALANAQFKEGESFIDGAFQVNLFDSKAKDTDSQYRLYGHNIDVSLGKFRSGTKAVGWSLSNNLAIQKVKSLTFEPKPLQNLGFSISRFWEFYKPLNDKFSLYARPRIGLGYNLANTFDNANGNITTETRLNSISLVANIGAGIAWRIAPKWAIYGGVAFSNPLDVSYSFGRRRDVANPRPDGQYPQNNLRGFSYRFAPDLSSGSIGLGFRYFY
ncbi:outer membrane protein [Dyadobacter sp. BHUBP1]|uniref:outer membrane protein n=1 Tax=Dyadobacter sp. BHUBP1 TaxID=3424178 RepID=UPI003D3384F9